MEQRFGFIRTKLEIKILILFILRRLPFAADADTLAELAICEDSISYFDYADALAELVETQHVSVSDEGYSITDKGRENGEITESSLPYSVRMRAQRATEVVAGVQQRNALIRTSHKPRSRGFDVELSLSDNFGQVISMSVYATNEFYAEQIEKNFRQRAEEITGAILDMLVTDAYKTEN